MRKRTRKKRERKPEETGRIARVSVGLEKAVYDGDLAVVRELVERLTSGKPLPVLHALAMSIALMREFVEAASTEGGAHDVRPALPDQVQQLRQDVEISATKRRLAALLGHLPPERRRETLEAAKMMLNQEKAAETSLGGPTSGQTDENGGPECA